MDFKYLLLDFFVGEGKDMGERRLIYLFDKEEYVRFFFNNFGEMQVKEGFLMDVVVCFMLKDYEELFYFMLFVVCSLVIKQSFMGEYFDCIVGIFFVKDCIVEVFKVFCDFLYWVEFFQDEGLLCFLKVFVKKYGIDFL